MDWASTIKGIMGHARIGITISGDDPILVFAPQYLRQLFDVMKKYSNR